MALPNGYQNYQKNKILTASPAQLTLMLYDGAIKFCNLAIMAIEEFRATLNFKYPVAQDFDNVYKYLYDRLVEANFHKDKEVLEEVLEHLRTMRATWEEVMKHSR